jgi:aspartate/methionine/tyrosine aminotransferase
LTTLSRRSFFDLSPNALSETLARARALGQHTLDLTESNPTRAGISYDESSILRAIASPESLRYEPAPFGLPSARAAVARALSARGRAVDAARVVLTASTSEAYAFLFKLLLDPGEEVLVPRPSYPLFDHLARLESVRPVPYRLAYDGAWHVDFPSVLAAISPRTRAVVVVHPNNPTGSRLTREELDRLAALGLPIVSDEVFAPYSLGDGGGHAVSALDAKDAELVFSLGGLSKAAALPQMKLAWLAVAGDQKLVDAALARLEVIADAFLSVGTPVQHAAAALLASRGTAESAIVRRIRANLAHLGSAVAGSPVSLLNVEAGWYAILRLPRTRSEEGWAIAFVEQDGVLVHPGHFFDFEDEAFAVVSLLTPEDTLKEGARRIVERVTLG